MKTELKKKLDRIAKLINELDTMIKSEHGEKSYLYFEAEGAIHAMRYDDSLHDKSSSERQEFVIERSNLCSFDCGAW